MLLALCPLTLSARQEAVPALTAPVVDGARIIQDAKEQELSSYLHAVSEQTGVQVAVLTVPSLAGEDIESYSIRVAEHWQLGQRGKDNGVLLVVAVDDRSIRIETGYGLEGVLTDAKCGMIIRNRITPFFKAGDYTQGIVNGVLEITDIATGSAVIDTGLTAAESSDGYSMWTDIGSVIFCLFFVLFLLTTRSGVGPFGLYWLLSLLTGAAFRPRYPRGGMYWSHDDRHDRFGGLGGGSGFSGGSHFSGGGGHFGGGGASGRW